METSKFKLGENLISKGISDEEIETNSRLTAIGGRPSPIVVKFSQSPYCQSLGRKKSAHDYGCGRRRNGKVFEKEGFSVTYYDVNKINN